MGADRYRQGPRPILRDYARSTSVLVTIKLGSGYAVTFKHYGVCRDDPGYYRDDSETAPATKLV